MSFRLSNFAEGGGDPHEVATITHLNANSEL